VDVAIAITGDRRLAAVRHWWRVRHPPPSLGQRLDVAYTAGITAAILGAVVYGTAGSALAEVLTPARLEAFGPAAALAGLVLLARWGAYRVPWSSPLPTSGSCSARHCRAGAWLRDVSRLRWLPVWRAERRSRLC